MALKDQFFKLKDNWLVILLVVVVLGASSLFGGGSGGLMKSANYALSNYDSMAVSESAYYDGGRSYMPSPQQDFAPDVEERKITKTASLSTEVERGSFFDSDAKAKAIIKSSDSYLLNQNSNLYGTGLNSYRSGYYSIKVETDKYDSVLIQLKEIGEVKSFNENALDITGSYTSVELELAVERERLKRYESMFDEAKEISDKIELNDRIFNQERTIKYLEDSLTNLDRKVDYSTISFTINEKRSGYANVVFVKFADLVKSFVNSVNSLFKLIFVLFPWAVAAFLLWLISKLFKRKN
ncbi:MAG: DUF4349 domain-containing protein [Nanoarchaeota archaeon]|nr:DUF4349 domain-containing protein [Nanoarchaeota archaeon]